MDRYFKIPKSLKVSTYHVFKARKEAPGVLFVNTLSSSVENSVNILANANMKPNLLNLNDRSLALSSLDLNLVRTEKHGNRYNYLKKEIIERYYKTMKHCSLSTLEEERGRINRS